MAEHPDFIDYVEKLHDQKLYREHEAWLQSTFLGRMTHSLLTWAKQSDFINTLADEFSKEDIVDNPYGRTLGIAVNIAIVVVALVAVYSIGRIIQVFIGKEIVVEQTVIIETQVKLSDLLKDDDEDHDDPHGDQNNDELQNDNNVVRRNKKSKVQ